MAKTPNVNSEGEKLLAANDVRLDEMKRQFEEFNPLDMQPPVLETEPQTKISKKEMSKSTHPYLKPKKQVNRVNTEKSPTYWDASKHQKEHDHDWEYVLITAENNELIGCTIEMWTAEYGCDPAHFWEVPVNKPIWVPRLVARKIARCKYHIMKTENRVIDSDSVGSVVGSLVATHTKHRLNAYPCNEGLKAHGF